MISAGSGGLNWPGGSPVAWSGRIFLAAFGLNLFSNRIADPDFWGHLAIGRLIWEQHAVPRQDPFSYLPTRDWINYEWLSNVVYYPLYSWLGGPGILLSKSLIGLATLALMYGTARRYAQTDFSTVLVLIPAAAVLALGFAPRAQVFTYFLFALWIALLEQSRRDGKVKRLILLPATMVLWANLHAGFLSGLGLCALYAVGQKLDGRSATPYLVALLAALAATLVNPYGVAYWPLLLEGISIKRPHITEWEPVPFDLATFPFFKLCCAVALASLFLAARAGTRMQWTHLLVLGATGVLSWKVQRHMPLLAVACGALVPGYLDALGNRIQATDRPGSIPGNLIRGLCLTLILGGMLSLYQAACPDNHCTLQLDESRYQFPRAAVSYLKRHDLSGRLAVEFRWGLYAVWNLYPDMKCSVDGRYETVFDPRVIAQDLDFFYGRKWQSFLEKYPADYLLTDSPALIEAIAREADARLLHVAGVTRLYALGPPRSR